MQRIWLSGTAINGTYKPAPLSKAESGWNACVCEDTHIIILCLLSNCKHFTGSEGNLFHNYNTNQ